jgi:cytochrome c peroxidase
MLKKMHIESPPTRFSKLNVGLKAISMALMFSATTVNAAIPAAEATTPPPSLKFAKVPEPANLHEFVQNKPVAIALGKALFWDMRVGSDGIQSCASCHFHAGIDTRVKNTLGPAHDRIGFHSQKPNDTVDINDFPFTVFSDITKNDKSENPKRDVRDVLSSQGVIQTSFLSVIPGRAEDQRNVVADNVFNVGGINTRKVEPRNTPTMINAVFNLRNFWDGRAQTIFNGVNPFGKRDPRAGVYKNIGGLPIKTKITLNDSSLASQASGPPESAFEMSADGRRLSDIGKKVIPMRILEDQKIASDDSVLGAYRDASGYGLPYTYEQAIQAAFKPEWWNTNKQVSIEGKQYSQMEANFSLFFSLAVQLYEATLVSDQAPYDRYMEGDSTALTKQQQEGLGLFLGKGKCINCHSGATFAGSSAVRKNELGKTQRISRMIMGDNRQAVYDEHFYNIGVTRTSDDIGVGGKDPFGNPLSFSRLAATGTSNFYWKELDFPNLTVSPFERVAVDGAFKTPTLRNVTLTAPYFHNGGYATLRSVVEFYNRGGNFPKNNINDLDPDIQPLGLSESEIDALVAFMGSLTDTRVEKHAAPFDHPELVITDGHVGDTNNVVSTTTDAANGNFAKDQFLVIPVVGKHGYQNNEVKSFLNIKQVP